MVRWPIRIKLMVGLSVVVGMMLMVSLTFGEVLVASVALPRYSAVMV